MILHIFTFFLFGFSRYTLRKSKQIFAIHLCSSSPQQSRRVAWLLGSLLAKIKFYENEKLLILFHLPDLYRHIRPPWQLYAEFPPVDTAVFYCHVPCIDDAHLETRIIIKIEIAEGRTHEAVVIQVIALYRAPFFTLRHRTDLVPAASVIRCQTNARHLFHDLMQQPEALVALAVQRTAM